MATFVLSQDNIFGFFVAAFPTDSVITAESESDAIAYAESLGVNFKDSCECCGLRWSISEYDSGFHFAESYYAPLVAPSVSLLESRLEP